MIEQEILKERSKLGMTEGVLAPQGIQRDELLDNTVQQTMIERTDFSDMAKTGKGGRDVTVDEIEKNSPIETNGKGKNLKRGVYSLLDGLKNDPVEIQRRRNEFNSCIEQ